MHTELNTICENQDKKWMACVCHSHSVVSPSGKQSLIITKILKQRRLVKGYDASSLVSPKEDYLVRKLNAHEHGESKYILVINWTKMYNSVD